MSPRVMVSPSSVSAWASPDVYKRQPQDIGDGGKHRRQFTGLLRAVPDLILVHACTLRPDPVSYTHLDVYKRQAAILLQAVSAQSCF